MLVDVVNLVRTTMHRRRCPADVLLGIEYLNDHAAPLRVVFVPTRDSFLPGKPVQGSPAFPTPSAAGFNPRPFLLRQVGFNVHLWAAAPPMERADLQVQADQDLLDSLLNQVLYALYSVLQGSWRQSSGELNNDTAHVKLGKAYLLSCTVEMPVVETDFTAAIDECTYTWVAARDVRARITAVELDEQVTFTSPKEI